MLCAKVAKDRDNIYFYVQTLEDVSSDRTGTWMNLYIDTDGDLRNNWNGYEFRVGGVLPDGRLRLEKYGGSGFEQIGSIDVRVYGNQLMLAVPKASLGIKAQKYDICFKWADSVSELETVEDFYKYGDTMPFGRFNYVFRAG